MSLCRVWRQCSVKPRMSISNEFCSLASKDKLALYYDVPSPLMFWNASRKVVGDLSAVKVSPIQFACLLICLSADCVGFFLWTIW